MPTTDPPRRRRRPAGRPPARRPSARRRPSRRRTRSRAIRVVVLVVAAALVLVLGRTILERTSGLLAGTGCTIAGAGGASSSLDPDQAANAATIAAVSIERRLPERAAVIAIATAMQESKLRNLDHGDRDSLGLFQQRPSQGWGTAEQVQNPYYASERFYDHLVKVGDWQTRPLTQVAQDVQRSGFPEAYAQHEPEARLIADAFTGARTGAVTCRLDDATSARPPAQVAAAVDREFGVRSATSGARVTVGTDTTRGASAVAAWAVAHAQESGTVSVSVAGSTWTRGRSDAATSWHADGGSGSTPRRAVIRLAGR